MVEKVSLDMEEFSTKVPTFGEGKAKTTYLAQKLIEHVKAGDLEKAKELLARKDVDVNAKGEVNPCYRRSCYNKKVYGNYKKSLCVFTLHFGPIH